jgi:hypothetical protein
MKRMLAGAFLETAYQRNNRCHFERAASGWHRRSPVTTQGMSCPIWFPEFEGNQRVPPGSAMIPIGELHTSRECLPLVLVSHLITGLRLFSPGWLLG